MRSPSLKLFLSCCSSQTLVGTLSSRPMSELYERPHFKALVGALEMERCVPREKPPKRIAPDGKKCSSSHHRLYERQNVRRQKLRTVHRDGLRRSSQWAKPVGGLRSPSATIWVQSSPGWVIFQSVEWPNSRPPPV